MLTQIKTLLNNKPAHEPASERMPADEGMRYRREMLYQSVRESLLAMEVLSNMYKFKVVNVDPRHHVFIVMVEVSKLFEAKWNGTKASFAQIERRMITGALNRAGVQLQAVYWRIDEEVDSYVMPARSDDAPQSPGMALRKREVPGDVSQASLRLARRAAEAATVPAPPAAAAAGSEIGGTQYGPL